MAYQFSDLKTELQNKIGDPNLDDTLAGYAINDAQQEIFNTYDTTLNSDQQTNAVAEGASALTTALPTDLQRIYSIYITSPTSYAHDLTPYFMSPKEFREVFPDAGQYTGNLREWTLFETVEFARKSNEDLVVKLDYIKSVPTLSASTDVPTVPEAFKELLMTGAQRRIFEMKEDYDYAGQFINRYADMLEQFMMRYGMRQVDNQQVVRGARRRVNWR